MSDVAELFERVAEQAQAQARPPSLSVLQRRRARRTAARGGAVVAVLTGAAAAVVLVASGPASAPDLVVADAVPSDPVDVVPSAAPVAAGQVAVPSPQRSVLGLSPGARPVADLLSEYSTDFGQLVTAGVRRGDELCVTTFTVGPAGLPSADAGCNPVTAPAYAANRIELSAASAGPSGGRLVSWLVLRGSAPPGTRTVVVRAAGGTPKRLAVDGAGPRYLDRAWFALPWTEQDTVVEALDAEGRLLGSEELLLGMGQPEQP